MPIYYGLALDEKEYYEMCEEAGIDKFDQGSWISYRTSHATTSYFQNKERPGKWLAIVSLSEWKARDGLEVAGLLVHEAVHIFQKYCELIGELHPSSEFQAYSIQWIAQELMDQFAKRVIPN